MTPAERAAMRETIARALRTADLPERAPEHPGIFRADSTTKDADLEARFVRELEALGGAVHRAVSADDVAAIVEALARREGRKTVLAWHDDQFPIPGMRDALGRTGCDVITQAPGEIAEAATRIRWAEATVGVTGAAACLAQTGSVVVVSGPGRGRLVSLLPPIHVAVVTRASLRWSLPDLLADDPTIIERGANVVCITGPSRTADIEHTLSRGVHGPREVHVVMVGA